MIINNKKIKRLIASGCSFCYGDELEDPSNQSWPKQLADILDIDCINLGARGMGNEYIQNSILDYFSADPHHKTDSFVIVSFTSHSRIEFTKSKHPLGDLAHYYPTCWTTIPYGKRAPKEFNELFLTTFFDDEYYYSRFLRIILLLQNYFDSNKIPYLIHTKVYELNKPEIISNLNNAINPKYYLGFREYKNCWSTLLGDYNKSEQYMPGKHPSILGHKAMSELLYNSIKNLYK